MSRTTAVAVLAAALILASACSSTASTPAGPAPAGSTPAQPSVAASTSSDAQQSGVFSADGAVCPAASAVQVQTDPQPLPVRVCDFMTADEPAAVAINLSSQSSHADLESHRTQYIQGGQTVNVSGLGDEAFANTSKVASRTQYVVAALKGTFFVEVATDRAPSLDAVRRFVAQLLGEA
jgi:hypothetical protein